MIGKIYLKLRKFPELIVLIVFFFFRLINLKIIPVFADEAIYIHWAQISWHDHTQRFISLTDGKPPLHTWLMTPFLKVIKDPLIAGRLLSVIAGLFTLIGLYVLCKKLFNRKIALLSAFFVSCSPFLVFYDRLAVADSLLAAFGVWSFYLGLILLEKPDLGKSFLLGFCWGGGLLTKQPALYFIVLFPLIAFLTENFTNKTWQKKHFFEFVKTRFFYIAISLLIAFLGYNVVKLSSYSHLLSTRSYDYILGKREFLKEPFKLFYGNLKGSLHWLYSYQTIWVVWLFFVGLFLMLKTNIKKALVFLVWLLVPIFISAAIGKIIFPRYYVFVQPWIIVFLSFASFKLLERIKSYNKNGILNIGLCFLFLLPWLLYSFKLIFNPIKAPLDEREQNQYLTTWSAGYGIEEITIYLKQNYPTEKVYVATEGYFGTLPDGLQIFLDGFSNIQVFGIGQPVSQIPEDLLQKAKYNPTYLVVNNTRYLGQGEYLELVEEYPKPELPFLKESLLFFKVKEE